MPKIAIITDTDSSLPQDLADKHSIRQVPITIHFDDDNYTTGVDINDLKLFEIIDNKNKLPTTAAPPPAAFTEAYRAAIEEGADEIICICISSEMSGTYKAAQSACEMFPEKQITVIDSLTVSMGQGFMALAAAEAAGKGASREEIIALVDSIRERLHIYGALNTLKYLALSGRVGKLAAGMANTLDIKPILTARNGKLDMLEKVRTQNKSLKRVVELTSASVADKPVEKLAIIHVNNPEGAQKLKQMLEESFPCPESILIAEFTPGLSVHTGSGLVAAIVLTAV